MAISVPKISTQFKITFCKGLVFFVTSFEIGRCVMTETCPFIRSGYEWSYPEDVGKTTFVDQRYGEPHVCLAEEIVLKPEIDFVIGLDRIDLLELGFYAGEIFVRLRIERSLDEFT